VRPETYDRKDGGALILAAGFSRRFGSDKRLHTLADGRTLLLTTLGLYLEVFEQLVVVLRQDDRDLHTAVNHSHPAVQIVNARDSSLGMGYSLAAGINAVREWNWVAVGLADMPFIENRTLHVLLDTFLTASVDTIVQPTFHERSGHPVFFGSTYFDALCSIHADSGARTVLKRHPQHLLQIAVKDEGVIQDLDQPT
jgi:molybdenum cofactor cytidylyltransferase